MTLGQSGEGWRAVGLLLVHGSQLSQYSVSGQDS